MLSVILELNSKVEVFPPPSVSNVIDVKNSVPSILLKFNLVAKNKSF